MKRREFIQAGAMVVAGSVILPAFASPAKHKIGLQLYTLRDIIGKDPKGVLRQVADLGYQELETFGYRDGMLFGLKAKEFGDYVKSLGMSITSGHYSLGKTDRMKEFKGTLSNDWERAAADAKEIGQEYMILAFLFPDERVTLDDYKYVCEKLNKGAEICKKYGLQMGYHNHDFEFVKIDDQVPYFLMLSQLDSKMVSMELDLYWTTYAGYQPVELFKKYPGRFEQWHIKDMDKTDRKKNANVGAGTIDFKSIFKEDALAGLKHYYVEHDSFSGTSIECVTADVAFAKTF